MKQLATWLTRLTMAGLVAFGLGFALFAEGIAREPGPEPGRADAIVALTGGEDRIDVAVGLLSRGFGTRLLISGVNKQTSKDALRAEAPAAAELYDCCIDIGREAQDTIGNASETEAWVETHGFRSLIIVTSSYHMPRSIAELQRAMPEIELVPHAVVSDRLHMDRWWRHPATARLLFREYLKFIPAAARLIWTRLAGTDPASGLGGDAAKVSKL
ncbi:MAG: YdcF family protein [Hyphomicrobiaceae bacterium]